MRNDFTDQLSWDTTELFRNLDLTVKEFINYAVERLGAFDITDSTFHLIKCGETISLYYNANYNQWFAKI